MFVVKTISILADNAGVRRIPRQRSGKFLDEARLGLVPAGETRIFARTQKKTFHEYRIALLVDCSGSMGSGKGSKLEVAAQCTHALEYALTRAGAQVDVYTFNGDYQEVPKKTVRDQNEMYRFCHATESRYGGDNNDADAVRITTRKLSGATEPGKILMVLSDGQPAPGCGPIIKILGKVGLKQSRKDSEDDLRASVLEARKQGIVCLAVGILTNAPVNYYGKHHTSVVSDLNQLYSSMSKMLEQNIQRG